MPNSESMHAYSKACLFLKITAMFFVNGKGFSVSAAACSPVLRVFCGSRSIKKESVKILIMIIAKVVEFVLKYAHLAQLR